MEAVGLMMADQAVKAAGAAGQTLMGQMFAKRNDKRQLKQAEKLMQLEMEGSKEMSEFQREQQMKLWESTNYGAQVEQLKKAGLSTGLMYGGSGPGGTTGTAPGRVSSQSTLAGNEMMQRTNLLGLAEIQNLQAQTRLTNVQADKLAGIDTEKGRQEITESQARVNKMVQDTNNAKLQGVYQETQNAIAEILKNWTEKNQEASYNQITEQTDKLKKEIKILETEGQIKSEIADSIITQTKQATIEQGFRIALQQQGLIKGNADINAVNKTIEKMSADIANMSLQRMQDWTKLDQNQKEIEIKKKLQEYAGATTEFNTGTQADIIRWINVYQGFVNMGGKLASSFAPQ